MPYPDWTAGPRITGERLRAGQPIEALKTADQGVTNSATLQPDAELLVPVVSGATYRGELTLFYVAPVAQDLRYAWSFPLGSSGRRGLLGPDPTTTAAVDLAAMQSRVSGAFDTQFVVGGAGGSHKVAIERFLFVSGGDGTLQLQIAQGTAAAATTSTVLAYSTLVLHRMS